MTDMEREFVIGKGLRLIQSLMNSISKAGGSPMVVRNVERLGSQTALQFLSNIAVNDIEFVYKPKD